MAESFTRMQERLRPANAMKVGKRAGEVVQITRPRGAPGRPTKRSDAYSATQAALFKSRQDSIAKTADRSRTMKVERDAIRAALGGQTPVSERGLHRPTPPRLPPNFRG